MAPVEDATSLQQFQQTISSRKEVAVHFWAPWSAPCKQMDLVYAELAAQCPGACFLRVEAEEVPDITELHNVSMVPHFVLLKDGKVAAEVEGADAPALTSKVAALFTQSQAAPQSASVPTAGASRAAPSANGAAQQANGASKAETDARIRKLLASAPVLLFMKGTPDAPRCGFSAKTVAAVRNAGCKFETFDILSDEAVRQGLKEYSNWPTYPQLYAGGELVGGCDLVLELQSTGDLASTLQENLDKPHTNGTSQTSLQDRLRQLTTASPVVLFMKGTPAEPRCGFSRKVTEALRESQIAYSSFDILQDEEVRQGLKDFSNWPTYPQLYAKGELLGGCDLVLELFEAGELKGAVEDALNS